MTTTVTMMMPNSLPSGRKIHDATMKPPNAAISVWSMDSAEDFADNMAATTHGK